MRSSVTDSVASGDCCDKLSNIGLTPLTLWIVVTICKKIPYHHLKMSCDRWFHALHSALYGRDKTDNAPELMFLCFTFCCDWPFSCLLNLYYREWRAPFEILLCSNVFRGLLYMEYWLVLSPKHANMCLRVSVSGCPFAWLCRHWQLQIH